MSTTFEFTQGNERLDWGVLVSIDVHRLMRDTNVDTLQRIIENLAFARVTRDEVAVFTPEHTIHLLQLSQVVIQYLVYSQECLAKMNLKLNERLGDVQTALQKSEDARQQLQEEALVLRKEVKAQRRTLMAYEFNAANGRGPAAAGGGGSGSHICPTCGEVYTKLESLQSHIRKRHGGGGEGGYAPYIPAYPGAAAMAPPTAAAGAVPPPAAAATVGTPLPSPEVAYLKDRLERLERQTAHDREQLERQQRDQLFMMLVAQNRGGAAPASDSHAPSPTATPLPATSSPLPAADSYLSSLARGPQCDTPANIASVPIMPDLSALTAYNESRQRESANHSLVRQITELEGEIRELRKQRTEDDHRRTSGDGIGGLSSAVPPPPPTSSAVGGAPPPPPPPPPAPGMPYSGTSFDSHPVGQSALPSWLQSPAVTSTATPAIATTTTTTSAATVPSLSPPGAPAAPPPPPLPGQTTPLQPTQDQNLNYSTVGPIPVPTRPNSYSPPPTGFTVSSDDSTAVNRQLDSTLMGMASPAPLSLQPYGGYVGDSYAVAQQQQQQQQQQYPASSTLSGPPPPPPPPPAFSAIHTATNAVPSVSTSLPAWLGSQSDSSHSERSSTSTVAPLRQTAGPSSVVGPYVVQSATPAREPAVPSLSLTPVPSATSYLPTYSGGSAPGTTALPSTSAIPVPSFGDTSNRAFTTTENTPLPLPGSTVSPYGGGSAPTTSTIPVPAATSSYSGYGSSPAPGPSSSSYYSTSSSIPVPSSISPQSTSSTVPVLGANLSYNSNPIPVPGATTTAASYSTTGAIPVPGASPSYSSTGTAGSYFANRSLTAANASATREDSPPVPVPSASATSAPSPYANLSYMVGSAGIPTPSVSPYTASTAPAPSPPGQVRKFKASSSDSSDGRYSY